MRRERAAIVLHERAALHGDIAALLDEAVLTGVDLTHADALRRRGTERHLADVARARAAGVRARLTAEGVNDVG